MEGASYEGLFVIADIRVDLPLPTERLAFFDPDWNRGNTVLMHPRTPRHLAGGLPAQAGRVAGKGASAGGAETANRRPNWA
jgi:hypothetical protein